MAQTATLGTNGSFSVDSAGAWTYTANSAFDNLNVGQSVSDTFTVASADGTTTSGAGDDQRHQRCSDTEQRGGEPG